MIRPLERLLGWLFPSHEDEEDPKEKLRLTVHELNRELGELKNAVASALTEEKRLRMEIREHLGQAEEWKRRAELALSENDESLAIQALTRRQACESRALELQTAWDEGRAVSERLKESFRSAKRQVSEAQRKYASSIARYESAKARRNIADTIGSTDEEGPVQLVERLEEKIRRLEAETEVQLELDSAVAPLEAQFRALAERRGSAERLDQLKRSMEDSESSDSAERLAKLKAELDSG